MNRERFEDMAIMAGVYMGCFLLIIALMAWMRDCSRDQCAQECAPLAPHVVHHHRGDECLCVTRDGDIKAPVGVRP